MDIEIEHLSYRYKEEEPLILDDIHLRIASGEWLLISGRSGCGKTTLAYAIAGFLYHQTTGVYAGRVRIGEKNIEDLPLYQIADAVGFVQQNADDQFCTLNVAEEVAFGLENKCVPSAEMKTRIADSMRITGIEALYERSLYELSGGEKQKVAIASVLALQPSILMLDEPTSNLDLKSARMIFEVLAKLQQTHQLTVIIIEHKVSLFQDLFKRCVHLENGKITFDGPITQSPFSNAPLKLFPKENKGETVRRAPILELKDWSCQYGNGFRLAIDTLEIYSGEIIALVGANGSGKTTLLKSLAGLVGAQNGQLTFRGAVLPMVPLPQIGLVFQNADEQIFMNTVLDEATYGLKNFHLHDDLHAQQMQMLFDQFGLSGKASTNPHQLSYGEKKRLNLISTLVLTPCILLLDEIFIGQDMYLVNFILERLCLLRNQGVTVMAAIHDPAMMHRMADRILFLEDGKMRFCLPLQQALIWWQVNGYRDYLLEKELRI